MAAPRPHFPVPAAPSHHQPRSASVSPDPDFLELLQSFSEQQLDEEGFVVFGPNKKRASQLLAEAREKAFDQHQEKKRKEEKQTVEIKMKNDYHAKYMWDCCDDDAEKRNFLEEMLPFDHSYNISKLKFYEDSELEEETRFLAEFDVNICREEDIEKFLEKI